MGLVQLWMLWAAILALLFLGSCIGAAHSTPTPTLTPTATPTLEPLPSGYWPMENYISLAEVIVIGDVTDCEPIQEGLQARYQDCTLEVKEYLTKPHSDNRLIVRSLWAVGPEDRRIPVKEAHLAPGDHVLLFLNRRQGEAYLDLQENQYTLLGPVGGKFWLENNAARNTMWEAPLVPLDDLRKRIQEGNK